MYLENIYVDGFKNISQASIQFGELTALVSLNNFGKSNLLQGIRFGFEFIKSNFEDRGRLMRNANLMPMIDHSVGKPFTFRLEFIDSIDDEKRALFTYSFSFVWKYGENRNCGICNESLVMRNISNQGRSVQLIDRSDNDCFYRPTLKSRCDVMLRVSDEELAINKLLAFDNVFYSMIIRHLVELKSYMDSNFNADYYYRSDPFVLKGTEGMTVDADNLPRVIYELKASDPNRFEMLKNVYFQLFPDIEDIIVRRFDVSGEKDSQLPEDFPWTVSSAVYVLYAKSVALSNPINFTLLSDGAKRIFLLLVRVILANDSNVSILAIEEPENSIHPSLLHAFLEILLQLSPNCRILITSHSPYILNFIKNSDIYVGITKNVGVATFYPFSKIGEKRLDKEARMLDISSGDYLFSLLSDNEVVWSRYLGMDHE